jgi:hypothetical protein
MRTAAVSSEQIGRGTARRLSGGRWIFALVCGFAVQLMPVRATAQDTRPTECRLKPVTGKLKEEFIAITSIRELHDGRILVTDPRDHRVVVADFGTQEVTQIGRPGAGPGEYPIAVPVRAIGGDSSIMLDSMSRRWLLFDADRIVGVRTGGDPRVNTPGLFLGADSFGHVLVNNTDHPHRTMADSNPLELLSRLTGHIDTIAKLSPSPPEPEGESVPTFFVWENAVLAEDGWVAIIRVEPYRVDWRAPSGRWNLGPPIPAPTIRFDARERLFFVRIHSPPEYAQRRLKGAPATVPPFSNEQLLPTMDGRVLVERTPTADHPEVRYDIINRRGELDCQVPMPHGQRIRGFGPGTVYVVVSDQDDIQRIERHPWP